jgi:Ca2+-transporting ATPase
LYLPESTSQVGVDNQAEPLTDSWRERIQAANDHRAQNGIRVLGIALQWISEAPLDQPQIVLEQGLTLIGLVGIIDPPRREVKLAVQTCVTAGIRPIMITGDHPLTAKFIGHDLGFDDTRIMTGQELNQISPADLAAAVENTSIFARVSPEHKLRIVEALQQQGHIVAMTGDGVNDSPALKKANIGVAMGLTGTDVSKEAADMVLVDDNFATIVAAVEEGRVIYDNIRRFIKFSIAGNAGKVAVMLFAPLLGITVALLPLQLLWLNLLTDGLLGLGLGVEPPERDTMKHPPRSPQAGFLSAGLGRQIVWIGTLIGLVGLGIAYLFYDPAKPDDRSWQTMLFTTLAFLQIGQALASRSSRESLFAQGLRSNPLMLWMVLLTTGLQLMVIYVPVFQEFFRVSPLSITHLGICIIAGSLTFVAIEIDKWLQRLNNSRK